MAAEQDVIREFLVSCGFHVDETSFKKFSISIETVTKTVFALGAAIAATSVAVVAGVKVISTQMEGLYYASQRTGETVGNIMSLRYAASQIGLTADPAQAALEGFAQSLRLSPGKAGLLHDLGINDKTPLAQFDHFIEKTKSMAPYVAAAYAQLFGIDSTTLQMLQQGHDKALASEAEYRGKLAAFDIDPEKAAESGKDFDNSIRSLMADVHLFWVLLQQNLAPVLDTLVKKFEKWELGHAREVAEKITVAFQKLADWVTAVDWDKAGQKVDRFLDKAGKVASMIGKLVGWLVGDDSDKKTAPPTGAAAADRPTGIAALIDAFRHPFGGGTDGGKKPGDGYDPTGFGTVEEVPPASGRQSFLQELEKKYAIPAGVLDGMWFAESSRGKNLTGPATKTGERAIGPFQFMKATADAYGISDRNDFTQAATGAAKFVQDLAKKYGGDIEKALAAYNWGGGNLDRDIAQHGESWRDFLPKQTSDYLGTIQATRLGANSASAGPSVTVQQKTDIHVSGAGDARATAEAVAGQQSRVNNDMVRNFTGAIS